MIGLFDIASKDQSVVFLGQIFGVVSPGVLSPSSAPMLMGVLFKIFNTAVLTIGAFIVIYTTVVGLVKTSQEGEFLGKQWSSLWLPLRTVFGIATLIPLPTGYCAIQVIFMWFILQGVGAADTLWQAVIKYNVVAGSPTGVQDSDIDDGSINIKFKSLFQGMVCQAEAARTSSELYPNGDGVGSPINFYCGQAETPAWCTDTQTNGIGNTVASFSTALDSDTSVNEYQIGPHLAGENGMCGTLTYCDEKTKCDSAADDYSKQGCELCKAQKQVLTQAIPVLSSIAEEVAEADDQYIAEMVRVSKSIDDSDHTTPAWVSDYCQSYSDTASIATCIEETENLSSIIRSNGIGNTSADLMKNVYWPYAIKPVVSSSNTASADYTVNFIASINRLYSVALKQAVIASADIANIDADDWVADAVDQGWIYAGAYFYKVVQQNKKDISVDLPNLTVTSIQSGMQAYRNNHTAANDLLTQMESDAENEDSVMSSAVDSSGESASIPSILSGVTSTLQGITKRTLDDFQNALKSDGSYQNPIIGIGNFGYKLMKKIMAGYWTIGAILFFVGLFAGFNAMITGVGVTLNPVGEALKLLWGYVSPFVLLVLAGLYSVGTILGLYVPLIPFIVFAMGSIGWMLATIEAVVAAPIVAIGVLSPGGQNEIFGRAEPALLMILNLFLRPGLMVVGLMAGTLVSVPVVYMVHTAFTKSLAGFGTSFGIFQSLILLAMYTSFIVTVIGKCYSLIYIVPERVLTWIGGQAVQYGEQEALQSAKQAAEAGASGLTGAAREATGSMLPSSLSLGSATKAHIKKRAKIKLEAPRKAHQEMIDSANAQGAHDEMRRRANENDEPDEKKE